MDPIDLFLSYHRPDTQAVSEIRRYLQQRGLSTFFDSQDIGVGIPWPQALEQALTRARAVAVFLGPHGIGNWQKRELWFALDRQVMEEASGKTFPVIPVLLPGAELIQAFIFLNCWVDLRRNLTDAESLARLFEAVRGGVQTSARTGDAPCPFRGLNSFREEDAGLFFGREAAVEQLLKAVLRHRMVLLVGPSGSGKSSVIQAGLVPGLRRQRPPSPTWDTVTFTPGDQPFHRFAAAVMPLLDPKLNIVERMSQTRSLGDELSRGGITVEDVLEQILKSSQGTNRLLVVIDQFEELFTLAAPDDRDSFIDKFLRAFDIADACWLTSLRADFYGHAITSSRALSDRMNNTVVNLGPMSGDELRLVVEAPAKRAGLQFESGLVDVILSDVRREPGGLPVLEFALTELWARRQDCRLTHAAYEAIGRVARAIANRAEGEYDRLNARQKEIARNVFTNLVRVASPGEGGDDTRRRLFKWELTNNSEEAVEEVIQRLVSSRLLVTAHDEASNDTTVEVAHEALIRNWDRLRSWLDEDREFHLWRQGLRYKLHEWLRLEKDSGGLLRGGMLDEAIRWLSGRRSRLSEIERQFIDLSIQERQAEVIRLDSEKEMHRAEAELRTVSRMHEQMLPEQSPKVPGFEISGRSFSAGSVGGDYFDFIPMRGGALAVAIADVSGHGLGPSLSMIGLRACLRAVARLQDDLATIMTLANWFLSEDVGEDRFATLFVAKLRPADRTFEYAGAGMGGFVVRSGGNVENCSSTGMPIGVLVDSAQVISGPIALGDGDMLLVATDGLFESMASDSRMFGQQSILNIAVASRHKSPQEIINDMHRAVVDFTGAKQQADDITIIVVKAEATQRTQP